MNKNKTIAPFVAKSLLVVSFLVAGSGCKKTYDPPPSAPGSETGSLLERNSRGGKKIGHFNQVNLVSNTTGYNAAHLDPTLLNGWGIAFAPLGIAWVSSQAGNVSDVFDREGVALSISPVHIPNPVAPEGGNPTGVVFNGGTDFVLPTGGAARFIFAGVDGVISAWNGAQGAHAFRKFTVPLSAFTGLATGVNNGMNMLYAANFRARKINAWDGSWNPVVLPFADPNLPAGYAPFNIQNIGGWLYVTYAKVASDGESEAGDGKGFVDIFNTNGTLLRRFASRGSLNAPWGVTLAPATFFTDEDDMDDDHDDHGHHGVAHTVILVGDFGDGKINAFRDDGKFLGQLRGPHHHILVIKGLWAIVFPPSTSTIDPNRLYFAAGPDDESDGLFGYILPAPDDDEDD